MTAKLTGCRQLHWSADLREDRDAYVQTLAKKSPARFTVACPRSSKPKQFEPSAVPAFDGPVDTRRLHSASATGSMDENPARCRYPHCGANVSPDDEGGDGRQIEDQTLSIWIELSVLLLPHPSTGSAAANARLTSAASHWRFFSFATHPCLVAPWPLVYQLSAKHRARLACPDARSCPIRASTTQSGPSQVASRADHSRTRLPRWLAMIASSRVSQLLPLRCLTNKTKGNLRCYVL